jgi:hypothetical protein
MCWPAKLADGISRKMHLQVQHRPDWGSQRINLPFVDRDGDRDLDRVTSIATSSLAKAVSLRGKRAHVVKGANALSVEVRWPESG